MTEKKDLNKDNADNGLVRVSGAESRDIKGPQCVCVCVVPHVMWYQYISDMSYEEFMHVFKENISTP